MHQYIHEYLRHFRSLVWNETERRPRAFVRIYIFFVIYSVMFVLIPIIVNPSGTGLLRSAELRLIMALCTICLMFGAAKVLDRRPIYSFGLRVDYQWIKDLIVGALLGLAIPTGAVLIGLTGGWLTVAESTYSPAATFLSNIGLAIVVTLCVAIAEETFFRGYLLTNAIEGLNRRGLSLTVAVAAAWGISAVFFLIVHSAPTLIDRVHFLGAGLLLGLAYLLTGQLALPIGVHAGFNFGSEYVFPVAQDSSVAIIPLTVQGPEWLIEQTGALPTGLQILAAIIIVLYVWWQSGSISLNPATK